MKLWIATILAIVLGAAVIFFVDTKPAAPENKEKDTMKVSDTGKHWDSAPALTIDTNKTYIATIETNKGSMKVNLLPKIAPKTVNNFVFLAKEKFYDGVVFHRIISGFMVQTGDPTGTGMGGPGYKFEDEAVTQSYVRGTLAMANAGPNTNGSQFFIVHKDASELPKNYTIFGLIDASDAASLKTLDAIAETPVEESSQGEASKPKEEIKMTSVTIEEK